MGGIRGAEPAADEVLQQGGVRRDVDEVAEQVVVVDAGGGIDENMPPDAMMALGWMAVPKLASMSAASSARRPLCPMVMIMGASSFGKAPPSNCTPSRTSMIRSLAAGGLSSKTPATRTPRLVRMPATTLAWPPAP